VKGVSIFGDWGTCSTTQRVRIGMYLGCNPVVEPAAANWGYVGNSTLYWYYMYSNNYVNVSRREFKKDITPLNESLYSYIMSDIDKIKPTLYKYKHETDVMEAGNEAKYRPNFHLGVILDEAPDYIQDNAFSGIDIYALSTLGIAGVKYNRKEIQEIKNVLGMNKVTSISDFGSSKIKGSEIWIDFSDDFRSKISNDNIPTVTVTPINSNASLYITEITSQGFNVKNGSLNQINVSLNWIAMTKVETKGNTPSEIEPGVSLSPDIQRQLKVPGSTKNTLIDYYKNLKPTKKAGIDQQEEEKTVD